MNAHGILDLSRVASRKSGLMPYAYLEECKLRVAGLYQLEHGRPPGASPFDFPEPLIQRNAEIPRTLRYAVGYSIAGCGPKELRVAIGMVYLRLPPDRNRHGKRHLERVV
jgi:hypothetical protein